MIREDINQIELKEQYIRSRKHRTGCLKRNRQTFSQSNENKTKKKIKEKITTDIREMKNSIRAYDGQLCVHKFNNLG